MFACVAQDGNTPLHLAAKVDHAAVVRILLLDPRVDVNKKNEVGTSRFFIYVFTDLSFVFTEIVLYEWLSIDLELSNLLFSYRYQCIFIYRFVSGKLDPTRIVTILA